MKPRIQTVFIIDCARPWRRIRERKAEIKSGQKWTWAVFSKAAGYTSFKERRTLLGKGAFFTRLDAERAKIGRLRIALQKTPQWAAPMAWETIRTQLAEYTETGVVH